MNKTILSLLGLLLFLASCTANNGQDGLNSLLLTSIEPAGANCPTGGLRVDSGLDSNSNGVLDTDEIATTNYICAGVNSLINVVDELAGGTCTNGGIRIETGQDTNGNGALDEEEIQITRFLCNAIGGGFDEQIRLNFHILQNTGTTSSTSGYLFGDLPNFNKNFWQGVDSITFAAKIGYRDIPGVSITTTYAEVFDVTNNIIIPNSLISTDEPWDVVNTQFHYSNNMFDYLPNEEIDLSILLRTGTQGNEVYLIDPPYLFLYRSN